MEKLGSQIVFFIVSGKISLLANSRLSRRKFEANAEEKKTSTEVLAFFRLAEIGNIFKIKL